MGKKSRKNKNDTPGTLLSSPLDVTSEFYGLESFEELPSCSYMKLSKYGKIKKGVWETGKVTEQKANEEQKEGNSKEEKNESNVDGELPVSKKKKKKRKKKSKKDHANKKPRYDTTNVCETTNESKNVDVSEWEKIFTPPEVLKALSDLGFSTPTEIQQLVLPAAIKGRKDIVGAAETGSGKTLAFGIPIIHGILSDRLREADSDSHDVDSGVENSEGEGALEAEDSESDFEGDMSAEDLQNVEEIDMTSFLGSGGMEDMSDSEEENEFQGNEGDLSEDDFQGNEGDLSEDDFQGNEGDSSEDDFQGNEGDLSEDDFQNAEEVEEENMSGDESEMEGDEISNDNEGGIGLVKVIENVDFDFLDENPKSETIHVNPLRALIVTPTRELAIQVKNHLAAVLVYTDIKIAVIVGGMASEKQTRILNKRPEIIVGTPGRLWELIEKGNPHLSHLEDISYLAIDETDRMVEQGHFEELEKILALINNNESSNAKRQNFVFSATLTLVHKAPRRVKMKGKAKTMTSQMKIKELAKIIGLKAKPKIVDVTRAFGTAESLTESKIHCDKSEKDYYLYYFWKQYPGRTLVFCNSIDCVRRLQNLFTLLECQPMSLHASMHQKQRLKSLEKFSSSSKALLLATDVAARGLDIPNIQHVIHYQTPRTAETYVHRSGRTARATQEGLSVLFVDSSELTKYRQLCNTLNRSTDLPPFPIEHSIMAQVKIRVEFGRTLESKEHAQRKTKANENWLKKTAREAELLIEEEEDSDEEVSHQKLWKDLDEKKEIKVMRAKLKQMLRVPLFGSNFSGKYPTQSGSLITPISKVLPSESGARYGNDALSMVKKESAAFSNLVKTVKPREPKKKKVNKKKFKGFEKRKLKMQKEKERREKEDALIKS